MAFKVAICRVYTQFVNSASKMRYPANMVSFLTITISHYLLAYCKSKQHGRFPCVCFYHAISSMWAVCLLVQGSNTIVHSWVVVFY